MDYSKKTLAELKGLWKDTGLKGYSTKSKDELIKGLVRPQNTIVAHPTSKNVLSLFSGAGGDTCGLEGAGWKVTHFSEVNATAIQTHLAAFPESSLLNGSDGSNDIKAVPDDTFIKLRGSVDLIFSGFPCQGFSHAGKKRADDPRNELVHEFVRATRLIQPTWIIGENVKGLLSRKGVFPPNTPSRPVIDIIKELFEAIDYKITYKVIDATEVGVPQLRKRLLIVGHKGSDYPHIDWPTPALIPPTIRALLTSTLDGAIELPALYKPESQPARFWIPTVETVGTGTPHPNLLRLANGVRNLSSKERDAAGYGVKEKILHTEAGGLISFGVRKSGYHGQVLDPDAPSKTIICAYNQCPRLFVGLYNATTGKYFVRCLTPVECGQIQGFPVDYPWRGSVKDQIVQIGNAVPPPLATALVKLFETARFEKTPQLCVGTVATPESDDEDD